MGSHALAPPLQLDVRLPARVRVVFAILAVSLLATAGVALALALPAADPSPPAHFEGDMTAR
jgi:hypothetical protein